MNAQERKIATAQYALEYAEKQVLWNAEYPRARKGWEKRARRARKGLAKARKG
jgi:hypothetical protein